MRGQAMVEFALILPLLAVLMVLAIDFGRVFFGWVGLQNAARIGANYAGFHPDAWQGTGDEDEQDEFRRLVIRDMEAINCEPLGGGAWEDGDIPDPVWKDRAGNTLASDWGIGDHVSVSLPCRFDVITPIAGFLVGDPASLSAEATFSIRGGIIAGVPVGTNPEPPDPACTDAIVPNLVGMTVEEARIAWEFRFDGAFAPPIGPDEQDLVTLQTAGGFDAGDCAPLSTSVVVDHGPAEECPEGELRIPNLETLTVAAARTAWTDAEFTGAFLPLSGYDGDLVYSQSTSTGRDAGQCSQPSTLVTVGHEAATSFCLAPNLSGLSRQAARSTYLETFTGNYDWQGDANGTVTGQSLAFGSEYECTADILVTLNR